MDIKAYNCKLIKRGDNIQIKSYLHNVRTGYKKVHANELENNSRERTQKEIERCVKNSINRTKQAIYDYALSNKWEWFVTLTFNPRIVNSSDYDECTSVLSKWLNNCRQLRCPNMVYLVVPEYHLDKQKFHFHILMSNISELMFVDSGRVHSGKPIYNIYEWNFGFSTAEKIDDDVEAQAKTCGYMLKYITKDLVSLTANKRRYWISRSTIKKAETDLFLLNFEELSDIREKAINQSSYVKTVEMPFSHNRVEIINI